VTLAFLGNVDPAKLPALCAIAGPLTPHRLEFDRVEHWSKAKVVVAGCSATPAPLRELVDQLWGRLDRLGFARDTRPFKPHITLARDARTLLNGQRWPGLTWRIDSLRLIESLPTDQGSRYQVLA
jgi:2'-5' RNA ligase